MPVIKVGAGSSAFEVEAILFDKDGTLLDFIYTWGKWSERLLASCSAAFGWDDAKTEELEKLIGIRRGGADGLVEDYDRNGPLAMGTVDDLLTIAAIEGYRSAGCSWAAATVVAMNAKAEADALLEAERTARLLPHVLPFLESCREAGLKLAVVTADETAAAERHLEWLGIRSLFDACVGTDAVANGKPFPDMALLACSLLGVEPSRTAVIGDTNGDMLMAGAAGAAVSIGIVPAGRHASSPLPAADVAVWSFVELAVER
jgi:phosphoglycolate phosphatase